MKSSTIITVAISIMLCFGAFTFILVDAYLFVHCKSNALIRTALVSVFATSFYSVFKAGTSMAILAKDENENVAPLNSDQALWLIVSALGILVALIAK